MTTPLITSPFQPRPSFGNGDGEAEMSRWLAHVFPLVYIAYGLAPGTRRVLAAGVLIGPTVLFGCRS